MNLAAYVTRDLLRNPRRTLASLAGVVVGVGLFSSVLFFIDGAGASMTRRSVAPLTLDMQRVLTAPLGGGITLERTVGADALASGESAVVTLTVANRGVAPSHEVVVTDRPASSFAYVPGSVAVDGRPVGDVDGASPLSQGSAGTGLNLGTVESHSSIRITYRVRAVTSVGQVSGVVVEATISTREAVSPAPANAPRSTSLSVLAQKVARIPGVQSADPLRFVDMASGSIRSGGARVPGPVKLFAFDASYQAHYRSIRVLSGGFDRKGVLVSAEAARALKVGKGDTVTLDLPGGAEPLRSIVTGIMDLSEARPLFESREASTLESFRYVPYTIVVGPDAYRERVVPAFEAAAAASDAKVTSLPLEELDILLDRSKLNADPATAVSETRKVAAAVRAVAPDQDYLIDNISNTLQVAKGDASVAKRMFVYLGLPGAVLAAILTAYAGTLLAEAQRRENALLRVRGAARRHLLFLLTLRTLAIAGVGSLAGTALGFASVSVVLGRSTMSETSLGALVQSALIGIFGGMAVTALALYVPGRRLITQEIRQELAVVSRRSASGWKLLRFDVAVFGGAVLAQVVALRVGGSTAPGGSVYSGQSVSLPLHLLVAPLVGWVAATALLAHFLQWLAARSVASHATVGFGRLLPGVLWRSVTRRLGAIAGGVITVGLVVGLGTTLGSFATVYDNAKAADARFLVGSDIRVTPNPTSTARHPIGLAYKFQVTGAAGSTAVVYANENAVLTSSFNEDVATMAAIDPRSFAKVGALQDSLFLDGSAQQMMSAMADRADGVLVNRALADGLKLKTGDSAEVLFGRGKDQQVRRNVKVLGLFTQFPGAPKGTDVVANLNFYVKATGLREANYFLVSATDRSDAGLSRTMQSLSKLDGFSRRFETQTTMAAVDKDQSSLTALNVRGLLGLDSFYTFLMAATATAMFVFGLLLQRRREYVTLRAQGLRSGEIRTLVLAEAGLAATLGTAIGALAGLGLASQFVSVLRPIFTLAPVMEVPISQLMLLAGLVAGATLLSSLGACVLIARLRPTELLRDE